MHYPALQKGIFFTTARMPGLSIGKLVRKLKLPKFLLTDCELGGARIAETFM